MAEKDYYNRYLKNFFWGREDEDKRRQKMVKLVFFCFKTAFLGHVYRKKSNTFIFLCMVSPLDPHSTYT